MEGYPQRRSALRAYVSLRNLTLQFAGGTQSSGEVSILLCLTLLSLLLTIICRQEVTGAGASQEGGSGAGGDLLRESK